MSIKDRIKNKINKGVKWIKIKGTEIKRTKK